MKSTFTSVALRWTLVQTNPGVGTVVGGRAKREVSGV